MTRDRTLSPLPRPRPLPPSHSGQPAGVLDRAGPRPHTPVPKADRPMKDILEELEKRRDEARLGGGADAHRRAARARQADRARAHRAAARRGLVRGVRHVRRAPLRPISAWTKTKIPGDGVVTGWGTVNGRTVYRLRQGLHGVRRLAVGDPRRRRSSRSRTWRCKNARADHRPVRRRRRAHPGGRRGARRLWRGVPAQRARLRRHPADLASSWARAPAATSIRRR